MTRSMGVAEVKAKLTEVLRELEHGAGHIVVVRRGKPVAVISPYEPGGDRSAHWTDGLVGALADDSKFEQIMDDVVKSRRRAKPRRVNLGP